jgi:hypothetical protein
MEALVKSRPCRGLWGSVLNLRFPLSEQFARPLDLRHDAALYRKGSHYNVIRYSKTPCGRNGERRIWVFGVTISCRALRESYDESLLADPLSKDGRERPET